MLEPGVREPGRRVIGKLWRLENGKLSCLGKGCHSVYEPREVIDPEGDGCRLWVRDT